jgi:hypothetical protein
MTPYEAALRGAFLTALTFFDGLLVGLAAGDLVFHLIRGSSLYSKTRPIHSAC